MPATPSYPKYPGGELRGFPFSSIVRHTPAQHAARPRQPTSANPAPHRRKIPTRKHEPACVERNPRSGFRPTNTPYGLADSRLDRPKRRARQTGAHRAECAGDPVDDRSRSGSLGSPRCGLRQRLDSRRRHGTGSDRIGGADRPAVVAGDSPGCSAGLNHDDRDIARQGGWLVGDFQVRNPNTLPRMLGG